MTTGAEYSYTPDPLEQQELIDELFESPIKDAVDYLFGVPFENTVPGDKVILTLGRCGIKLLLQATCEQEAIPLEGTDTSDSDSEVPLTLADILDPDNADFGVSRGIQLSVSIHDPTREQAARAEYVKARIAALSQKNGTPCDGQPDGDTDIGLDEEEWSEIFELKFYNNITLEYDLEGGYQGAYRSAGLENEEDTVVYAVPHHNSADCIDLQYDSDVDDASLEDDDEADDNDDDSDEANEYESSVMELDCDEFDALIRAVQMLPRAA